MIQKNKSSKFHFGYIILLVCFLNMALQYPTGVNLVGLFFTPLEVELETTGTAVIFAQTLFCLGALPGTFFAGSIIKRFGMRKVMSIARIVVALFFVLVAMATSLTQIYVLSIIRGFFCAFLTVIPIAIILKNWFAPRMLGKVLGIAMCGSGVGTIILTPATTAVIEHFGWQGGYIFFAILTLIMLPITAFAYVDTPAHKGCLPVGFEEGQDIPVFDKERNRRLELAEKTPKDIVFWMAVISIFLLAGSTQTWNTNVPSYLTNISMSSGTISQALSVAAVFLIVGKLGIGSIGDHFGAKRAIMVGAISAACTGVILIPVEQLNYLVFLAAVTAGVGMSVITVGVPLLATNLLSRHSYEGTISYLNVASSLGGSLLPLLVSAVYDTTGSYGLSWGSAFCLAGLGLVLILSAYAKLKK